MAIWSELAAGPLIVALPVWVLATRGLREMLRYTTWLLVSLAFSTLIVRELFGIGSITFNLVELPSRHPWSFPGPQFVDGLLLMSTEFLSSVIAIAATIVVAVVASRIFTTGHLTDPPSSAAGLRRQLVENPWLQFVLVAIASAPVCFLKRAEVGGYLNDYSPILYFLAMGLVDLLLQWHATNRSRGLESLNAILTTCLLLLVVSPMTISEDNFQVLGVIHRASKNPQEVAFRYSRRHPGTAYFPWNPLSSLLGERKLYHFEYGLVERDLSGYPVSGPQLRRNLPDRLRYLCFPPHYAGLSEHFEKTRKYLPEFTQRVEIGELPGWTCYERVSGSEVVRR